MFTTNVLRFSLRPAWHAATRGLVASTLVLASFLQSSLANDGPGHSTYPAASNGFDTAFQDDAKAAGSANQDQDSGTKTDSEETRADDVQPPTKVPEIKEDQLVRLNPEQRIWFDRVDKFVVVDGEICLRRGQLEVFACPVGTKEHEAVAKVFSDSFHVHLALLRVGAIPGSPVSFDPEYKPAKGMIIDIWAVWEDEEGNEKSARAQEWVRNSKTEKQLDQDWVFGGSGFWVDEETEERFYMAEGGELICLSNFSTATMDLPIQSSDSNDALLFEPFTERVPNRGTKIRLILKPRIPPKNESSEDDNSVNDKGDDDSAEDDDKHDGSRQAGARSVVEVPAT
jgi:hypothetical protein